MTTGSAPVATDRSDFRNVMVGGTKIGLVIGLAVLAYVPLSRVVPAGVAGEAVLALVVLVAAAAASFLPARWTIARTTEGVAGAAALGLWGTVVFSAFDIVILRPLKWYPWTWDAVGGGSTWWYLPVWWMLGTYLAWMGGLVTAARSARGDETVLSLAVPPVIGAVVVAAAGKALWALSLPLAVGAGYAAALTAFALAALARKS